MTATLALGLLVIALATASPAAAGPGDDEPDGIASGVTWAGCEFAAGVPVSCPGDVQEGGAGADGSEVPFMVSSTRDGSGTGLYWAYRTSLGMCSSPAGTAMIIVGDNLTIWQNGGTPGASGCAADLTGVAPADPTPTPTPTPTTTPPPPPDDEPPAGIDAEAMQPVYLAAIFIVFLSALGVTYAVTR